MSKALKNKTKLNDVVDVVADFGADPTGLVSYSDSAFATAITALAAGGELYVPTGIYKFAAPIVLPRNITLRGQGVPFPVSAYNPTQRLTGVVFNKLHSGHCITVTGTGAYSESAGIYNIAVISNNTTYTAGDGIRIDQVGSYVIEQCSVWSCGGNGFSIGATPSTDVTGQVMIKNLYVNNCTGYAYYIRSKWLRAYNLGSDGCTWGAWFQDAGEGYIDGFHFEGFSVGGIRLAGGSSGWNTFQKGFISLTNGAALYGVYLESVAGNTGATFDSLHMLGRAGAGVIGFNILSAAWNTRISKCYIGSFPVGVSDAANYTCIQDGTVFDSCALPIASNGGYSRIRGIATIGTTGGYSIDHQSTNSALGVWEGNYLDTPIKPTIYGGTQGNFGTNLVVNNTGFKTKAAGVTGVVASGTAIPHGMSVTPSFVSIFPVSPFVVQPNFTVAWDSVNVTPAWTGGGSIQLSWQAQAICSSVG